MSMALVLLVAASLPVQAPKDFVVDDPKTAAALSKLSNELLEAHNRERAAQKLSPLTLDPRLSRAAEVHAHDMAQHKTMSHTGSDKSEAVDRIVRQKYRYVVVGENVARGQEDVKEVMKAWMESPGHRDNILGDFTQMGAGVFKDQEGSPYWCVDFGTPIPKLDPVVAAKDALERINAARSEKELPKLLPSAKLDDAARGAAAEYAKREVVDHEDVDPADFAKRAGYRYETLAQSVSRGAPTAKALLDSILKHEDQKEQFLGDFKEVGIGYAQDDEESPYWVILFAKPRRLGR